MPTYNGWTVVTIPSTPPAPRDVEFTQMHTTALNRSPFTGQQQVQDWGGAWMEAVVTLPSLSDATAQAWITFFRALKGQACVFQFTSAMQAAFPASIGDGLSPVGGRYWRLKQNSVKWSLSLGKIYGVTFEIVEAL